MNEMNAKYYEVIYDKRLGGDNVILYGENMDLINSFPYKTVNGEIKNGTMKGEKNDKGRKQRDKGKDKRFN